MNYKSIPSPLLNEDTFIVISQRKYKYTSFFFLLKKRGSYCPLLIYRTLTLVTFFWIGNLLLLKEGWKDLWIFLGYKHFFQSSVPAHLYLKKFCVFFFSALSDRKLYLSIKYYYIVCGLIFMLNFIKYLLKANNAYMFILFLQSLNLII